MDWIFSLFGNQVDTAIFAAIAIVGFLCLAIALIADGVFDFLDFDFETGVGSFFNAQGILAFVTGFGATGWILTGYAGISPLISSLAGLGGGVAVMVPIALMHRMLIGQVGSTNYQPADVVGTTAMVTLAIPPRSTGSGQIVVSWAGGTRTVTAQSSAPETIPQGQVVRIRDIVSGVYYVDLNEVADSSETT